MPSPITYNAYMPNAALNNANASAYGNSTAYDAIQVGNSYGFYRPTDTNTALQSPWVQSSMHPYMATPTIETANNTYRAYRPLDTDKMTYQHVRPHHIRPLATHTQPTTEAAKPAGAISAPVLQKAAQTAAPVKQEGNNFLMRNPARQLGFLNEYAEIFKSLVPARIYQGLWAVEMAYISAESILSSLINARRDAKANNLTPRQELKSDGVHLGSRALFHSIATVGLPTAIISGVSPLAGKEMHGIAGGLKGIAEMALKRAGAAPGVIKYGTVGLTLLTLPFMSHVLDPIVERTLHKVLPNA